MRVHIFSLWSSLMLAGFAHTAFAATETVRVARCHTMTEDFSVLSEKGHELKDGAVVTLISSRINPKTGLNFSIGGVYDLANAQITLPTYWRPKVIALGDCKMRSPWTAMDYVRPPEDYPMYLVFYFVFQMPGPDADLDQMVRDHEAILFKAHVICRAEEETDSPMGCDEIRFLDQIIPVDGSGIRVMARGLSGDMQVQDDTPHNPQNQTLTLESRLCGTAEIARHSASAVNVDGHVELLTSAAAVLSQYGKNSCNEVLLPNGKRLALRLVRQDWESGLALLDFVDKPEALPGYELRPLQAADIPDSAVVVSPAVTSAVEVLASSSTRHFIPRIERTLEVLGGDFTAEVEGAAVLDDSGKMLGLVSHEYLKIFPGSFTRPVHWRKGMGETSDHLVVIGATDIVRWLKSTTEPALWAVDADLMQMKSGHLVLSEDCPPFDSSVSAGDYPIGGGDPVGIGGDDSGYRACKIKVAVDAQGDSRFFNPALQGWHDQVEKRLLAGADTELYYKLNSARKREYFYSLESFFQQIAGNPSEFTLLEVATRAGETIPGLDPSLAALRSVAATEGSAARTTYVDYVFNNPALENLLRSIYFVALVAQSEQWKMLSEAQFLELMPSNPKYVRAWSLLTTIAPGGMRLQSQLEVLHKEWVKASAAK